MSCAEFSQSTSQQDNVDSRDADPHSRGKYTTTPSSSTSSVSGCTILRNTARLSGGSSTSRLKRLLVLGDAVILRHTSSASSPEMRKIAMADLPLPVAGAKMVGRRGAMNASLEEAEER